MQASNHIGRGKRFGILAGAAASGLSLVASAQAAPYVWTKTSGFNYWSTPGNFTPGVPANSADTELTFSQDNYTASENVATPFILNKLTFSTGAGYPLLQDGSLDFQTNTSSVTPQLLQNSAGGTYSAIASPINLSNNLAVGGTGTNSLNLNGVVSGAGGITKSGTFTVVANKANTFNGPLVVQKGTFAVAGSGTIASTNATVNAGGTLVLGDNSAQATVPDRLGDAMTLELAGGIVNSVASNTAGATIESVGTINISRGKSALNPTTGGGSGSALTGFTSTASHADGATLTTASSGLGGTVKILLSNGASLLRGPGTVGTTSTPVIPWYLANNDGSGNLDVFATYDANGVRPLASGEMASSTVNATGQNVRAYNGKIEVNANTTVNSLMLDGSSLENSSDNISDYFNNTARVLTVTSGGISLAGGRTIGTTAAATNGGHGSINFGNQPGYIFIRGGSAAASASNTATIGSVLTNAPGNTIGLVKSGNSVDGNQIDNSKLILLAHNTYTGKTIVSSGTLQMGDGTFTFASADLGAGDVTVDDLATLSIMSNVSNAIDDGAAVDLRHDGLGYGMMNLGSGIDETVSSLFFDGVQQASGTWGGIGSNANHIDANFFVPDSGVLTVTSSVPEPASFVMLTLVAGGCLLRRRR